MALETTFSGDYYVRGFYNKHQGLREADGQNSYMDSRFRLKTVFQITDNLKLTTRFDALDQKVWGDSDNPNAANLLGQDESSNIDFDRVILQIKTPWGGWFDIGRMGARAFGLTFVDDQTDRDRIKYTHPLGDLTVLAVVGKKASGDDLGHDPVRMTSEGDWTGYSLAGILKLPIGKAGLLLHLDSDQRKPDMNGDGVPDMMDWNQDGEPDEDADRKEFFINPYWDVTLMDTVNFVGEVKYELGKWEYDLGPNSDVKRFAANFEANAALPTTYPVRATVGYAYMSGDFDFLTDDTDYEQKWYKGGIGADWEKVWILTNDSDLGASTMGGIGNLVYGAGRYGAQMVYLGVSVSPLDGLDLGLLFATSTATDVAPGWSDEHGIEWDLSLSYKVMDNLTYDVIAAFLSAGDFWKLGVKNADLENAFSVYQQLTLKF